MSDLTKKLLLEVLISARNGVAELKRDQKQTLRQLSSIEQRLLLANESFRAHTDDIESLRERVERIERRLELTD